MAGVSDVQVDFKMQTVTDVLDGSDDPEVDDHLDVVAVVDGGVEVGDDEVGVVGQPAHSEHDQHYHEHDAHLGGGNKKDIKHDEKGIVLKNHSFHG